VSIRGEVPNYEGTSELEWIEVETIYESLRINFTKIQYKKYIDFTVNWFFIPKEI